MKAIIIITTTMCASLIWAVAAGSQMSDGYTGRMPMADQPSADRMMHDHMKSMAQMMSEMAAEASKSPLARCDRSKHHGLY